MNNSLSKSFLPSIQKKVKSLCTPKTDLPAKKQSDSVFLSKGKTSEKMPDFQQPPPKIDKLVVSKPRTKEDVDKAPPYMLSQSKKGSYSNLPGTQSVINVKKTENSYRQSRFETLVRPLREAKESSPRDRSLSASLSPEKRPRRTNGNQSSRSKSEFTRMRPQIVSTCDRTFDINEYKAIDSMELDHIEETQCEFDEDLVNQGNQMLKSGKKKKGFTALSEMVPQNLEEEKQKFFEKEYKYNPQFEYINQNFKQHFEKPHTKYLKVSKMILNTCIRNYKDDEEYLEATGGRLITREETETYFDNYIKEHGLEGCLDIVFSENTVAPTSVIHDPNGKSRVVISLPITYRENRIMGVMHHEIGTHFIRKHNDRMQAWFKNRKKFELKPYIIIEEGLAALNQNLEHAMDTKQQPYLWNSALHYYSCYMSSVLGFDALFKDLEKYIKDPVKRWKECVRVKRGISDTSQPGGMYKDQVYLRGAIEILKKRKKIDFVLLYSGKINLKDLKKLIKNGAIKNENLKLPGFLKNLDEYKAALDRMAATNFIDSLK